MKTMRDNPHRLDPSSNLAQLLYRQMKQLAFLPSPEPYNLTICHDRKFVWFRVAKVGTRTILNHFRQHGIQLDVEHAAEVHYCPKLLGGYFKFGFVRNPWSRFVSCWRDKVSQLNSFKLEEHLREFGSFLDLVSTQDVQRCNRHFRSQCSLIDLNNVDFLGRQETFDDDFRQVCQLLDIPCQEIRRRNTSKDAKPYQSYFDDEQQVLLSRIYQKDVQVLGYRF